MTQVFAVLRTRGPAWEDAKPLEGQAGWPAHAAFMDALFDEGVAVLVGPLEGTRDALLILRADSAADAAARLAPDPWTISGLLTTKQITPWQLRLGSLDRRQPRAEAPDADRETVSAIVRRINDHWRQRRYDKIGELLADEVVLAAPGFGHRVTGPEAYVKSYRDYDAAARTLEFSAGEPQVDLAGDTAVAVCPFDVTYELDGVTYHERGHDILAFNRSDGTWKVVWRTMQSAPVTDQRLT
jgi:uncharacterized protein YciI/ketosteroid isomerase-like protein